MARNKTIYYIGQRYLTELKHPVFGTFPIEENTGKTEVPVDYADNLVSKSPAMWSEKLPKDVKKVAGSEYAKMSYHELVKYAQSRNVETFQKKKVTIIDSIIKLDQEEKLTEKEKKKAAEPSEEDE